MGESSFTDDLRRNILTGVAALFPIVVTLFLLGWLYRQIDGTVGRGANAVCQEVLARVPTLFGLFFPRAAQLEPLAARREYAAANFPGVVGVAFGLLTLIVGVYLVGKSLRGYIGGRAMAAVDRVFTRFPVIKSVYPHARQVADLLFGQGDRRGFRDVVVVQYPRRGVYSVGFLTGRGLQKVKDALSADLLTVFVPTSPTPLTGFVLLVPADEVVRVDMTVDEALRYFITAGMLAAEGRDPSRREPSVAESGRRGARGD